MIKDYSITIAAARTTANLQQTEFAEKLGVTAQTISHWENNKSEPTASQLQMISKITGIPERYISLPNSPNESL